MNILRFFKSVLFGSVFFALLTASAAGFTPGAVTIDEYNGSTLRTTIYSQRCPDFSNYKCASNQLKVYEQTFNQCPRPRCIWSYVRVVPQRYPIENFNVNCRVNPSLCSTTWIVGN